MNRLMMDAPLQFPPSGVRRGLIPQPGAEEVFHLMVSQSVPSGISCSEAGCIDVSICLCTRAKTLSFGVVLLQLI